MKYYPDMRTKFGFNDGDDIPVDAWDLRIVYIEAMNDLAVKRGSGVRAYAYDRTGIHNNCQILFHDLEKNDVEEPDAIMETIIEDLSDVDFGDFLRIFIRINDERLKKFLESAQ